MSCNELCPADPSTLNPDPHPPPLPASYAVQPLRDALVSASPPAGVSEPGAKLLRATKELFSDMRRGGAAFPPLGFLYTLREKFPQFAQQGAGGAYMQQDAEECWTNLLYALREKLKVGRERRGAGQLGQRLL